MYLFWKFSLVFTGIYKPHNFIFILESSQLFFYVHKKIKLIFKTITQAGTSLLAHGTA